MCGQLPRGPRRQAALTRCSVAFTVLSPPCYEVNGPMDALRLSLGATQCKQTHPRWYGNELVAPRNLSQCVILITYVTSFPHPTRMSSVQGTPAVPPLSLGLFAKRMKYVGHGRLRMSIVSSAPVPRNFDVSS